MNLESNLLKEFERSETKYSKGSYTWACITARNKKVATKKPKIKQNKVLDMLLLMMEVKLIIFIGPVIFLLTVKSIIYHLSLVNNLLSINK